MAAVHMEGECQRQLHFDFYFTNRDHLCARKLINHWKERSVFVNKIVTYDHCVAH